jgi:4-amino-4-deoxy-L-arabinose transferase-like glycosyltransferase
LSSPPSAAAVLRALWLPALLHIVLCLGVYQYGFSDREMQSVRIEGASRLVDPYLKAYRLYGPTGVIRTYLRGEQDERLYLEYARLLLLGEVDLAFVAKRQNDPSLLKPLPPRPWPYKDVRVEYPPLAYAATLPPALVSFEYRPYRYAFAGYMLLLHALNLWLCAQLLRGRAPSLSKIAWGSLAFCAALGTVFVTRMDHVVVTSTLLVVWAFARAQDSEGRARVTWAATCGAFTALGVMVKLVPGLAGAAAVVLWLRSRAPDRFRLSGVCVLVGTLVFVAVNLAVYLLAGPNYAATFRYHALRGVQIESTYAGLIMLLRPLGFAMRVDESFGSTNLASAATELVKHLSTWLLLAGTAYLLGLRRFASDARGALLLISALLLTFMLTNRVFSPQYLIWVAAPLCVLYAENAVTKRGYYLFIACVFISQLIFPRGYPLLKAFHPLGIFLLDVRNLSLIGFGIWLVRQHSQPVRFSKKSPA